jgi:hypothetical protein
MRAACSIRRHGYRHSVRTNEWDPEDLVGQMARFVTSDTLGAEFIETLQRLETALKGIDHVLIGGQAVFFSGYERFSADVDVGVLRPVREVSTCLTNAGFVPVKEARFVDPRTHVEVDVVKLPRCMAPSVKEPRRVSAGPGLDVPVLGLAALVASKVETHRIQDEADVVELLKAGAVPDRAEVARLLRSLGRSSRSYDRLVARAEQEKRST